MNTVASSLKNEIFPGSNLLSEIFSFASSKAGNEESIPENDKIKTVTYAFIGKSSFQVHDTVYKCKLYIMASLKNI